MPEIQIVAEPRTEFGKGAARRTRRANRRSPPSSTATAPTRAT